MIYKIYIHHYYTYELFWYFCHGIDINPKEVPAYFPENRRNKNKIVDKKVKIIGYYRNKQFEINFVGNSDWHKNDGDHVFDYSVNLLEKKLIGDRGFNKIMSNDLKKISKFLNTKCKGFQDRLSFFYIDWERNNIEEVNILKEYLNYEINIFLDDTRFVKNNQYLPYTHIVSSYLFPNTINLKEYFFYADFLKNKKDFKYKVNYPIRRITESKLHVLENLLNLNNPYINVTISSFTEHKQHETILKHFEDKINLYNKVAKKVGDENIIKKRGYNLDDWGGEWNDNNMNEYMWKLLQLSEVVLIHEVAPYNWINEKTLSHILSAKPFIPVWENTIEFYLNMCKNYNMDLPEYPIDYKDMRDMYSFLDNITRDENRWRELVEKLYNFSYVLRNNIIEIIHNNNDYFNFVIDKSNTKKSIL